jgi:glutamyl-tRNA reductase
MTYLWAACATHHRVPVSLLERFPRGDAIPQVLARLRALPGVTGALVLSTCNRYEIYLTTDRVVSGAALEELLTTTAGMSPGAVGPCLDVHAGDDAVHHLFSVSAGLDSRAPGEGEILGQLRAAAQTAAHEGSLDRELATLVQWAVRAGRRARRAGGSPAGRSSVGSAGVRLVRRELGDLSGRRVLVVGAGRVAGQAVRALAEEGAHPVVAARDPQRAAERFPGRPVVALPLSPLQLADVDAVVCATGAPGAILTRSTVQDAFSLRGGRPLVVVDLAVPRDVEPDAAEVPGLTLLDLDALPVRTGGATSGFDAARATVRDEAASYLSARAARHAGDLLAAVTARAEQVRREELARVDHRVSDHERDLLDEVTRRVLGTLLHPALVGLRDLAAAGDLGTARQVTSLLAAGPDAAVTSTQGPEKQAPAPPSEPAESIPGRPRIAG